MNYAELTRSLTKFGCCFRRHAKGGHEIWWHPQRRLYIVVPHYPHFKPNRNNTPSINTLTQYFVSGVERSETQPTRLGSPGLHFSASSTISKRAMWEYVSVAWIWITWPNKPMLRKNPELVKDVLQAV